MTVAITVEFLHGVFRADPIGGASTGTLEEAEWPPAPSRLFAALVAADGTGERRRVTDGSELEWFERLPPPAIHASGPGSCGHQRLEPRFVVRAERTAEPKTHQEYVGRRGALIRPGVRVAPRRRHVSYLWADVAPPGEGMMEALRLRCARVGYLGAADSPVRLRLSNGLPPKAPSDVYVPADGYEDGCLAINVPRSGDLQTLDAVHEAWKQHGPAVTRAQFPALRHEVWYRPPSPGAQWSEREQGLVVAWLRLGSGIPGAGAPTAAVSGRRVSALTALFKAAVLRKYEDRFGSPPRVLHGHGYGTRGYDTARFLALPNVGFERSDGRIHGLALWMPKDSKQLERSRARDAALAVRRLVGRGIHVAVAVNGRGGPVAANPERWRRASRRWCTAFPAVHERRRRLVLSEVARWCRHAGLPAPVACRSARTPLVRGGVDLAPVEVNRPGREPLPYSHVELLFDEQVRGPVVIGAGRQRGLGLCVPVAEDAG